MMNPTILKRISLVATAALVASGAAMAQSSSTGTGTGTGTGNGGSSNATGAVNGSSGTSGTSGMSSPGTSPNAAPSTSSGTSTGTSSSTSRGMSPTDMNGMPSAPSVDYNRVDPTAAGATSTERTGKSQKARHTGSKKGKHARDAASSPSVLDDPNRAGGGSGNSNVR